MATTSDTGDPSPVAKRASGMKVVESPPWAPFPDGVPPWAMRCHVEEEPGYPVALQPWILGAGIAGVVGGMVATVLVTPGAFVPVPLALVALYYGIRPPPSSTVLRPAVDGWYLAYSDREPETDHTDRVLAGLLGPLAAAFAIALYFADDGPDWYGIGLLGSFAVGLIYHAVTGRKLDSDEAPVPPASAKFRALADPTRPLGAEDAGLTPDHPATVESSSPAGS